MEKPFKVEYEDSIRMKSDPSQKSTGNIIYTFYEHFVRDVPVGSSVLIDDGSIALAVMEKDEEYLYCNVENDGVIQGRKSINIPSVHVKLPALSDKDKAFIEFAADNDVDFIAHYFVRSAKDVIAVQNILDKKRAA